MNPDLILQMLGACSPCAAKRAASESDSAQLCFALHCILALRISPHTVWKCDTATAWVYSIHP